MKTESEKQEERVEVAKRFVQNSPEEIERIVNDLNMTDTQLNNIYLLAGIEPPKLAAANAADAVLGRTAQAAPQQRDQMSDIGQIVGGAVGGITKPFFAVSRITNPLVLAGTTIAESALKTVVGAALGYESERNFRNLVNDADLEFELSKTAQAGGTEGLYDVIGSVFFKTASKLGNSFMKFKPKEGREELQNVLNKKGTTLSLEQYADNEVVTFLGEVLRGYPLTSGAFERLGSKQTQGLVEYYDDLAKEFASVTTAELSSVGFDRMLRIALKDTKKTHREQARSMYAVLDEAASQIPIQVKEIAEVSADRGKNIVTKTKMIKPVNISQFRGLVKNLIEEIESTSPAQLNEEGLQILKRYSKGDTNLTLGQTAQLIQDISAGFEKEKGKKISTKLQPLKQSLEKQFNEAADKLSENSNFDFKSAYNKARVFYKLGAARYNKAFIEGLLDGDSIDVGRKLLKASPDDIVRLKKVLSLGDKTGATDVKWNKVKAGMLANLLPQNLDQLGRSAIDALPTDRRLQSTLKATFGDDYKQISTSLEALSTLYKEPAKGRNLLAMSARLLAPTGLAGGAVGYAATSDGESSLASAILSMYAAPKTLATAMTNKTFVNTLVAATKTKDKSSRQYGNLLVRLVRLFDEAKEEFSDTPQDVEGEDEAA
tara:strand:- start:154 stop:2130 length:1977 start_codon:yes stop_codon:yes gene_type:complete